MKEKKEKRRKPNDDMIYLKRDIMQALKRSDEKMESYSRKIDEKMECYSRKTDEKTESYSKKIEERMNDFSRKADELLDKIYTDYKHSWESDPRNKLLHRENARNE